MSPEKVAGVGLAAFILGAGIGYHSGLSAGAAELEAAKARFIRQRERIDHACRVLANIQPDADGFDVASKASIILAVSPDVPLP